MYLNTDHPEYNPVMELLCLLSTCPAPVPCLMADLRATEDDILRLVREARSQYKLRFVVCRLGKSTARLHHDSVRAARKLATSYWTTVYGESND